MIASMRTSPAIAANPISANDRFASSVSPPIFIKTPVGICNSALRASNSLVTSTAVFPATWLETVSIRFRSSWLMLDFARSSFVSRTDPRRTGPLVLLDRNISQRQHSRWWFPMDRHRRDSNRASRRHRCHRSRYGSLLRLRRARLVRSVCAISEGERPRLAALPRSIVRVNSRPLSFTLDWISETPSIDASMRSALIVAFLGRRGFRRKR